MTAAARLRAFAAGLLAALAGGTAAADATLQHGPFEIVAQGRRTSAGGFPNTSGNPFATIEVTSFAVRWRGQEVEVPDVGRRFWRVLRLIDAPQPALLVSTTDFHLLTERDGQLRVESLGPKTTNLARVQWLDSERGQPGPVMTFGIQKVVPDDGTLLAGGRWLRLAATQVLDVKTLRRYEIRPIVPRREGEAMSGLNATGAEAIALSPSQQWYVTSASQYDRARHLATGKPVYRWGLAVVHVTGAEDGYGIALDRAQMRYSDGRDFDHAWVMHHFEWVRSADGAERLRPRARFERWPWRVRWSEQGEDTAQFVVPRAMPALADVVRRLMIDKLQATVTDDSLTPGQRSGNTLHVPACNGNMVLYPRDGEVSVYLERVKQPPFGRCREPLRQLAALVEAELASGRHEALFISAD